MTTPAIRAVRERYPKAKITLLASKAGSSVVPMIPEIDDFLVFNSPFVKTYEKNPDAQSVQRMVKELSRRSFDSAIIFTVFSQSSLPSAFLIFLAKIPLVLAHNHENPYHLVSDWVPDPEPKKIIRHEVERQLALVNKIGCKTENKKLSLKIPGESFFSMEAKLKSSGIFLNKNFLLIHPGCSEERRCFKKEGFIKVGQVLRDKLGAQIIVTGSRGETSLCKDVAKKIGENAFSMAGKTDLKEFSALISLSPLLISNNTGPIHIAAALGTPVVDIYAKTNPQHTPWQVPAKVLYFDVPCKDCERGICAKKKHPKIKPLKEERIINAALDLFDLKGRRDKERFFKSSLQYVSG